MPPVRLHWSDNESAAHDGAQEHKACAAFLFFINTDAPWCSSGRRKKSRGLPVASGWRLKHLIRHTFQYVYMRPHIIPKKASHNFYVRSPERLITIRMHNAAQYVSDRNILLTQILFSRDTPTLVFMLFTLDARSQTTFDQF